MGEAKRRKPRQDLGPNTRVVSPDGPEVHALLEKGQPINVHLLGAGAIVLTIRSLTTKELMAPEQHAFRLAFQTLDRIRTGEIEPWQCFLCGAEHVGMQAISVMAVIERTLGEPRPDKHGIVAPICYACDSVSTDETRRLIQEAFGLLDLQRGRA
jgi:hypothetical protein